MNCRSCAAQLPVGVSYCPQCGVVTPYAVSDAGISPDDETAHPFPPDASARKPSTDYGPTPDHVSGPYIYPPLNPYEVPQQTPPPPPRQPKRLSVLFVGSIVLLLILIGSGVAYATITGANQFHAQATATAQIQQKTATALANRTTATAFANTPQGIYDSVTRRSPVLDDSLSQNDANNWDESQTATYSCSFSQESYHASLQSAGNLVACADAATNFSNFAFQIQMIILKGDSGGILFRFNGDTFTGYSFNIAPGGTYALSLLQGNTTKDLGSGPSSAIKTGFYQTNLIAVVANGSRLYLYVNKQFVTSVSESTFHSGQIGVQATENSLPTEVAFQHAQVWQI